MPSPKPEPVIIDDPLPTERLRADPGRSLLARLPGAYVETLYSHADLAQRLFGMLREPPTRACRLRRRAHSSLPSLLVVADEVLGPETLRSLEQAPRARR